MKNLLITGVAGFIGSRLSEHFLNIGFNVTGIDNLTTGFTDNIPSNVKFVKGDCSDVEVYNHPHLKNIKFDTILHIAGQSSGEISFDDPVRDLSDNCISTLRLLDFARDTGCNKFIFASTMSVYGESEDKPINENYQTFPLSMYAVGKLASERYLQIYSKYGIDTVSLRLFNVYGPGQNMTNLRQGMASIYIAQALKNAEINVKGSPDRFRDLIFIDDVISIFESILKKDFKDSEIYNVCTGKKTKVFELIEVIKNSLDAKNIPINYIDGTPGDQFGIVGDNSKLKAFIGDFKFTELNDGISQFISSLNN